MYQIAIILSLSVSVSAMNVFSPGLKSLELSQLWYLLKFPKIEKFAIRTSSTSKVEF